MSPPSKPRRRWFQYGMRTLLLGMTLVIILLVAWRYYVEPYHQQRETMALVKKLGGKYESAQASVWLRWLYGNDFQNVISVNLADCDDPDEYLHRIETIPCLKGLVVGGLGFRDKHLRRLDRISTLEALMLDSADVSESALASLKSRLPALKVSRSERRAITELAIAGAEVGETGSFLIPTLSARRWLIESPMVVAYQVHANRMDDGVAAYFKVLPNLEDVMLYDAPVGNSTVKLLARLRQLTDLGLVGNKITPDGWMPLSESPSLKLLFVGGSTFGDRQLRAVQRIATLRDLVLDSTSVSEDALAELRRARPQLAVHRMQRHAIAQIRKLGGDVFIGSHNIQLSESGLIADYAIRVVLADVPSVNDGTMFYVSNLRDVAWLDLSNTSVTDAGLAQLHGLRDLNVVHLSGTKVTAAGIKQLRAALPNCTVYP